MPYAAPGLRRFTAREHGVTARGRSGPFNECLSILLYTSENEHPVSPTILSSQKTRNPLNLARLPQVPVHGMKGSDGPGRARNTTRRAGGEEMRLEPVFRSWSYALQLAIAHFNETCRQHRPRTYSGARPRAGSKLQTTALPRFPTRHADRYSYARRMPLCQRCNSNGPWSGKGYHILLLLLLLIMTTPAARYSIGTLYRGVERQLY